jgi:polyphosphate glucokinase
MEILGIDIGGSSIKGALVDISNGSLTSERIRIPTPEPQKPKQVGSIVAGISRKLGNTGILGVGFPSVIKNGVCYSAANVHKAFMKADVAGVISKATGCPTFVLNDADAAGIAEMRFGIGKGLSSGSVLFITIGTGIGSAFFINGQLLPNTELGHLKIRGKDAEDRASDAVRQSHNLSWKEWGKRLTEVLRTYEFLFNPDLIILGGGISSRFDKYEEYLNVDTKIVPAKLENLAGIIGAAMAAAEYFGSSKI